MNDKEFLKGGQAEIKLQKDIQKANSLFMKKIMGNRTFMSLNDKKINRNRDMKKMQPQNFRNTDFMTPKLIEIQKLAKTSRSESHKKKNNVISDLEIYMMEMTAIRQKAYDRGSKFKRKGERGDEYFRTRFNEINAIKKRYSLPQLAQDKKYKESNIGQGLDNWQIKEHKEQLATVVKSMFAMNHNDAIDYYSQHQAVIKQMNQKESIRVRPAIPQRQKKQDIRWVLNQCQKYQNKFIIQGRKFRRTQNNK